MEVATMTTMAKLVRGMTLVGFAAIALATQGCAAEADDDSEEDVGSTEDAIAGACKVLRTTYKPTAEYCNPVDRNSDSCVWPVGNKCYGGKISIATDLLLCGGNKKVGPARRKCING